MGQIDTNPLYSVTIWNVKISGWSAQIGIRGIEGYCVDNCRPQKLGGYAANAAPEHSEEMRNSLTEHGMQDY